MIKCAIVVFLFALTFPLVVQAQTISPAKETDWVALENEPSRQELINASSVAAEIDALPISGNFTFPQDTESEAGVFGIDISHHNKRGLPFEQLADRNIKFVYVKATQGTDFKDGQFAANWTSLGELTGAQKVFRGAYHFLSSSAGDDPELQAERFVAYVSLHGGFRSDDMPPSVDLEWDKTSAQGPDRWANRTTSEIISTTLAFLERLEKLTGRVPMIYTARSWWDERGIPESEFQRFSKYPIWIADYSRRALKSDMPAVQDDRKPALWQFSEKARLVSGYADGFDADLFPGVESEFLNVFFPTP